MSNRPRVSRRIALFSGSDRNNQTAFGSERLGIGIEIVSLRNRLRRSVISASNRSESLAGLYLVIAPPDALVDRNRSDRALECFSRARGQMQLERLILWSRHAQQAGIEVLKIGGGSV